jgi:hypothetical protein
MLRDLLAGAALALALSIEVAPVATGRLPDECGSDLDCACLARALCAVGGFEPFDPYCNPVGLPERAVRLAAEGECERQGGPGGEGWR